MVVADDATLPPALNEIAADLDTVRNVKANLNITFANGDTVTNVTQNVTLPTVNADPNVTITWASSNTDVITNDGTVKRPRVGGDKTVILTATIKKGKATVIKTFTVTVNGDDLVPAEPTLEASNGYSNGASIIYASPI